MRPDQEARRKEIDLLWNEGVIGHDVSGAGDVVGDLLNMVDDMRAQNESLKEALGVIQYGNGDGARCPYCGGENPERGEWCDGHDDECLIRAALTKAKP